MSAPIRQRRPGFNIWPGFVDALTSLILVMIFMLLLFAIGQFVLSDALAGKNRSLDALNVEVKELADKVFITDEIRRKAEARIAELLAALDVARDERDRFKTTLDEQNARAMALSTDIQALDLLKRQLEEQLNQLTTRLDSATQGIQSRDAKIVDLDRQLKLTLANQVNELEKYRSEFFGKLREALGKREDVRVVGDRFVLPSDILFTSGSADLGPNAQARLGKLVNTIRDVSTKIPEKINWVLRVDGHTDRVPIASERFPSNWELSTARAVAMVKWMVSQGIPAKHLSANGFGQHQPIDTADTPEAYTKNRRIEFQLTNR